MDAAQVHEENARALERVSSPDWQPPWYHSDLGREERKLLIRALDRVGERASTVALVPTPQLTPQGIICRQFVMADTDHGPGRHFMPDRWPPRLRVRGRLIPLPPR